MKDLKKRMVLGWILCVAGPLVCFMVLSWVVHNQALWNALLVIIPLLFIALAVYFTITYKKSQKSADSTQPDSPVQRSAANSPVSTTQADATDNSAAIDSDSQKIVKLIEPTIDPTCRVFPELTPVINQSPNTISEKVNDFKSETKALVFIGIMTEKKLAELDKEVIREHVKRADPNDVKQCYTLLETFAEVLKSPLIEAFRSTKQIMQEESLQKTLQADLNAEKASEIINYKKGKAPTGHQNDYRNYLQCLKQCKNDVYSDKYAQIKELFESVKEEIKLRLGITTDFSDEEYCNLAAWFAVDSCISHGLSGYSYGNVYVDIKSISFLNCLIFTMLFFEGRGRYAFILDKAHLNEIQRDKLRQLSEKADIKLYIYLKLDPIVPNGEIVLQSDESSPFSLWNVIDEQFYAVIRKEHVTREREDGYPIDIYGYIEKLKPLQKTPELAALEKQLTGACA